MNNKKGQAAMEFLMTYGWAILVVLIAIGALAYFGVLNPGRFLPSSCTIMPGVSCEDFQAIDSTDTVSLTLRNGIGDDVTNVTVLINQPDSNVTICTLTCSNGCTGTNTMPDGQLVTWTSGSCTAGTGIGAQGSKFKADILFTYTTGSSLSHTKTGSVTTQVE
jgi:uncharacterized protein (UPF0333 family)